MAGLPPEISKQIVTLLHQQDKVECMTVCRQWNEIISTHCLFHTVRICDIQSLKYLETKFRQYPQQGAQVRYLVLEMNKKGRLDMREFMRLIPNLKYLYSSSWDEVLFDTEPQSQPWHHRIEQISLQANQLLTVHLIFSKKLSQLKRLLLTGIDVFEDEFFDQLPNISTLSHLTLLYCNSKLTLTRMELFHNSLPLLESLTVDSLSLSYEPLPFCISPAVHMVRLCLRSISSANVVSKVFWLDYIGKKYPNISHLETHYLYDRPTKGQNDQGQLVNIEEGYSALFHGHGSRIRQLHLRSESIPRTLFRLMDDSGCQLQHLKISKILSHSIYNQMAPSGQANYIQRLDLNFKSFKYLGWIKNMPALTTLSLDCSLANKKSIEFTRILDVCPDRLESLHLRGSRLTFNVLQEHHSLKSLYLIGVYLFEGFDVFISACLPQLKVLKFDYCSGLPTKFTLLTHALSRFEVMDGSDIRLQVKTRKDKKTRTYVSWYLNAKTRDYDNDMPSLYPSPRCQPQGPPPDLILECVSVEKIVL